MTSRRGIYTFDLKDREDEDLARDGATGDPELFASLGATCEKPAIERKVIRKRKRLEPRNFTNINNQYCRHFIVP